jgi:hypothetical protein
MISVAGLQRSLQVSREAGGYEEMVILDEDGHAYEVIDVEMPGNGRPLVLRIQPTETVKSN